MKNIRLKFYLPFVAFAYLFNTLIESFVVNIGIVNYTVGPRFLGIAWFTYIHYLTWTLAAYLGGNYLSKKLRFNRYFFYFIVAALYAFCFDLYYTSVNYYYYNFPSIFLIGKVPIEDFFAVGAMMGVSIVLSEYLAKRISKS